MRPIVGPPGSGAELELCGPCTNRLRRFTLELPPDCEAVDYRAIPLSCKTCRGPMLALVSATAAAQRGTRRTAAEQREALEAFAPPRKGRPPLRIISRDGSEKVAYPMVGDLHMRVALCGCTRVVNAASDATMMIAAFGILGMLQRVPHAKRFLDSMGLDNVPELQDALEIELDSPACQFLEEFAVDGEEEPPP